MAEITLACNCDPGEPPTPGTHSEDCPAYTRPRPTLFADHVEVTDLECVLLEVGHERLRQEEKCNEKLAEGLNWYSCNTDGIAMGDKLAILTEEVGEVAKECCDMRAEGESGEARLRLRTELIQVAAVAVAWAESL